MHFNLTKTPEGPQGNKPGDGQPMRDQTLREWALEMKSRHPNAKFRLVVPKMRRP